MIMNENDLLFTAINAALAAGEEILDVYGSHFDVEMKADKSPLTLADRRAHETILHLLSPTGFHVLSEEGKHIDYPVRKEWKEFWMVDPLDGTKEFIKRNGEFTVNIALIKDRAPVMGVIFVPVSQILYFASLSSGAFKINLTRASHDTLEKLMQSADRLPSQKFPEQTTIVCSRSHLSPETEDFIENMRKTEPGLDFVSIGSSLKMCLVAEGKAHLYPRFGPTMEWDTAAGQAIVEIAGGRVLRTDNNEPVRYNKPELLNPYFLASAGK